LACPHNPTPTTTPVRARDTTVRSYWSHFHRTYWEKRPLALASAKHIPAELTDEDALFKVVCKYMNAIRGNHYKVTASQFQIFLDGNEAEVTSSIDPLLPRVTDGSFRGYHKRCAQLRGFREYGVVIHNIQQHDDELWNKVLRGFRPLLIEVGIPQFRIETSMWIGNYRHTPAGVHIDDCGVFHMPIVGTKRMHTWTQDYIDRHPDLKYSRRISRRHRPHSTVVEASPGGLVYWPSDRWHVAESSGNFSVTFSLGYWFNQILERFVEREVKRRTEEACRLLQRTRSIPFRDGNLRRSSDRRVALDELRLYRSVLNSDDLDEAVERRWLEYVSAYGFTFVPSAERSRPLRETASIQQDTQFPVLWTMRPTGELIVACRGRSLISAAWAVSLLQRLSSRRRVSVAELIGRYGRTTSSKRKVTRLLRALYAMGAFEIVAESRPRQ